MAGRGKRPSSEELDQRGARLPLRWVTVTVVAALGVLALGIAPALASYIRAPGGAPLRWCTDVSKPQCKDSKARAVLAESSTVTMRCWFDDGAARPENPGFPATVRYFFVESPNGTGYLHASWVGDQSKEGYCKDKALRQYSAANWAAKHVGEKTATAFERRQLKEAGSDWAASGDGPAGEWSGDCYRFAFLAWYDAGKKALNGLRTALRTAKRYKELGKLKTKGTPPVGAMIFYTGVRIGDEDFGHVAISIGNGLAVSTKGVDGAGAKVRVHRWDGVLKFYGYVTNP